MTVDEIRDRHAAATPGPWRWFGNTKVRNIYLATVHSGRRFVMLFRRWDFGEAQPEFQVKTETGGVMVEASKLVEYEVEYRKDISRIVHPDAIFLENSWADVDWLLRENARLQAELDATRVYFGVR